MPSVCYYSKGRITVRGKAVGKHQTCGGKCGVQDQLFLYRGAYDPHATSNSANVLAWDERKLDKTIECVKDETFTLCEKVGIIITDSVSFTFSSSVKAPAHCDAAAIALPCPRGSHPDN